MEFLPSSTAPPPPPKTLIPCLAVITVGPHEKTSLARRLSGGSLGSGGDGGGGGGEDNALKRVISGGRRKSSFGQTGGGGQTPEERRASLLHPGAGASAAGSDSAQRGTWYWRVQAGVNDTHLVLLPLSLPPNPVLTQPPAPLSQAMPAHSAKPPKQPITLTAADLAGKPADESQTGDHEGLVDKHHDRVHYRYGNHRGYHDLGRRDFRVSHERGSSPAPPVGAAETTAQPTGTATINGKVDKVLDQTAEGDQLPTRTAGATEKEEEIPTYPNANAETGWPGVIKGDKLGAIIIPFSSVVKDKVGIHGGKKNEDCWVTVHITSQFAGMVQGMGSDGSDMPKSGSIKFEFDKDWIGAKGEAEVLHFQITNAVLAERSPAAPTFRPGSFGTHPNPGMAEYEHAHGPRHPFHQSFSHPNPGMSEVRRSSMMQSSPPPVAQQPLEVPPPSSAGSGVKISGEL
ncbi:hypothetical protein EHS25_002865 [Saitozyma podzolica]|uniref:Uncharacterized protein n=1 Tax=Saitozyma podzolica TaxID=1890683 RepID=A0A427YC26_9TREE|nr:hypothetical protein EHS25_002865 [Saitozyma podzolica]